MGNSTPERFHDGSLNLLEPNRSICLFICGCGGVLPPLLLFLAAVRFYRPHYFIPNLSSLQHLPCHLHDSSLFTIPSPLVTTLLIRLSKPAGLRPTKSSSWTPREREDNERPQELSRGTPSDPPIFPLPEFPFRAG